jgi:dihydropteroate synthase
MTQAVERQLGRVPAARWSPRVIDIDLLLFGDERSDTPQLTLPHSELANRCFVLDPLKDLLPTKSYLSLARQLPGHQPLLMEVLNLTPDSFSDGGEISDAKTLIQRIHESVACGVHILDFGAESTRPGAKPVGAQDEWTRLKPALEIAAQIFKDDRLRPRISVDSRHVMTVQKLKDLPVDIINDVSGLADTAILDVLAQSPYEYILMHSLDVPVDADHHFDENQDVVSEVSHWLEGKLEILAKRGVSLERVIFDPGIGFGKTRLQSIRLMRHIRSFFQYGIRILVGHSRKSWMNDFTDKKARERDWESVGASLALAAKGVDVLRVHNADKHIRAIRAWHHLNEI